jgi:hypothetical protein
LTEKTDQSSSRRFRVALLVSLLALTVWPVAGVGGAAGPVAGKTVRVVFTGKGGGRYLDHTRWLREDTRLCYASRLADEDLSVSWRLEWTATLVRAAGGYALSKAAMVSSAIAGSVDGTSVRDSCDSADEEPGWSGETDCRASLGLRSSGSLSARASRGGLRLALRGPVYASPGSPCELDIRNDQLVAGVILAPDLLARIASGRAVTVPVGTRHPGVGVSYKATRSCSHFPHLYDGVVYLYDCDDTLIWSGGLSVAAG